MKRLQITCLAVRGQNPPGPAPRRSRCSGGLVHGLLATALLLPAADVSAQHTVSLLGGINLTVIANQSTDDRYPVGFQRTTGTNLGLAASFMLSPEDALHTLSAQLAGTYSEKGAWLGKGESRVDYQMDYLEVALLADMRFASIVNGVFIHFLIGPTLAWLRTCQRNFPASDDRPATSSACKDGDFRNRDHGIAVGSGLEFALTGALGVTASFMYGIGLSHVDQPRDEDIPPALKHRALTLRAALSYPIG